MKRFHIFPGIIFALLGMNVAIVGYTVYAANSDGGAAIEPDYYRKALAHDVIAANDREAAALGWTYHVEFTPDAARKTHVLRASIADSSGAAVTGANVRAEAFPSVRANERVRLLCLEGKPGEYAAPISVTHHGQWRVELIIESRGRIVAHKSDVFAREAP